MTAKQTFRNTLAVVAALALAYILFTSLRILIVLLIAIIIASAVRPFIVRLTRWHIPEGLAILLAYLLIALVIITLAVAVLPPIVNQMADFLQNDWQLATRIVLTQNWIENNLERLTGRDVTLADPEAIREGTASIIESFRTSIPQMVGQISGTLGDVVLVFVMGVYWLTSRDKTIHFFTRLSPRAYRERVNLSLSEIETALGSYTRGVVFVAVFVGTANFILLSLFRIPNAGTLAFIIGVCTMLPVIGGLLGGGLATLLAVIGVPWHGLIVFGVFVAVQQIEVHYLTPRTMARSIGVDPLLVMLAIFIGFAMFGVVGAIISIPILGSISILLQHFVIEPYRETIADYTVEDGLIVLRAPDGEEGENGQPVTQPSK